MTDRDVYVGLDIGGTKITGASCDAGGEILHRERHSTPASLDDGLELLHAIIGRLSSGGPLRGIAAAIGGPIDFHAGVVSPLHQPEWRNVPLRDMMKARWKCRFHVDVDTNIAALAEYDAREPKPRRLLYVTVSTGMGGGFLMDGAVYRGADHIHPEIAHQSVAHRVPDDAHVMCECGSPDCLEAVVSGNGIRRVYGKPAEELSASQWSEVGFNLGLGLRNAALIYAPDLIVLGGSVAIGGGVVLLEQIDRVFEDRIHILPRPPVRLAKHGHEAPVRGALLAARRVNVLTF